MKKKTLWKLLFLLGLVPFVAPFLSGIWNMLLTPSWTLPDWLILYSVIYWPSYLLGAALLLAALLLKKRYISS